MYRKCEKRDIILPKRLWFTDSENEYTKKPPKGKISLTEKINKIKQRIKDGMQRENYSLKKPIFLQKRRKKSRSTAITS